MRLKDISNSISIIKDPFLADKMTNFNIYCGMSFNGWYYKGSIEFKNGATAGKQSFEGESLQDVLQKMETFVKEELGGGTN